MHPIESLLQLAKEHEAANNLLRRQSRKSAGRGRGERSEPSDTALKIAIGSRPEITEKRDVTGRNDVARAHLFLLPLERGHVNMTSP